MHDVSVVCISNDGRVLRGNLGRSLFVADNEFILVKNPESATKGLNEGIEKASNDVVVMVHQDVFLPKTWSGALERALDQLGSEKWGVLGVAGMTEQWEWRGYIEDRGAPWGPWEKELEGNPIEVYVLDELLMVIKKSDGLRFDEKLKGFHLYASDICLNAKMQGMKNFVFNGYLKHNSDVHRGNLNYPRDPVFLDSYYYLRSKYRNCKYMSVILPRNWMKAMGSER